MTTRGSSISGRAWRGQALAPSGRSASFGGGSDHGRRHCHGLHTVAGGDDARFRGRARQGLARPLADRALATAIALHVGHLKGCSCRHQIHHHQALSSQMESAAHSPVPPTSSLDPVGEATGMRFSARGGRVLSYSARWRLKSVRWRRTLEGGARGRGRCAGKGRSVVR
jgi:hypothetical protein